MFQLEAGLRARVWQISWWTRWLTARRRSSDPSSLAACRLRWSYRIIRRRADSESEVWRRVTVTQFRPRGILLFNGNSLETLICRISTFTWSAGINEAMGQEASNDLAKNHGHPAFFASSWTLFFLFFILIFRIFNLSFPKKNNSSFQTHVLSSLSKLVCFNFSGRKCS